MEASPKLSVVGILVANSAPRRSCCDKKWTKKPMGRAILSHVIKRIFSQVSTLTLNANEDPTRFQEARLLAILDVLDDHPGIFTNILTGMKWAHTHQPKYEWIATLSTKAPFIPQNLVLYMLEK